MSLLVTWPDGDPATAIRQTADPAEISAALGQIGCRFERRAVRADVDADADQETVLAAYRDVIEQLVSEQRFVTVDVAAAHPSDNPDWPDTAKAMRAKFIDEHTHGDDDEVRFMIRGGGAFYLHIGGQVHAVYAAAGDLLGVPQGTTHWFDTGLVPDFTAIRFFHARQGWVGGRAHGTLGRGGAACPGGPPHRCRRCGAHPYDRRGGGRPALVGRSGTGRPGNAQRNRPAGRRRDRPAAGDQQPPSPR